MVIPENTKYFIEFDNGQQLYVDHYDLEELPKCTIYSRVNMGLLVRVRDLIASRPEQFNYSTWVDMKGVKAPLCYRGTAGDLLTNCNTAGCIAGWTAAIVDPKGIHAPDLIAQQELRLTNSEAEFLFYGRAKYWFEARELDQVTYEEALDRIDCLIKNSFYMEPIRHDPSPNN